MAIGFVITAVIAEWLNFFVLIAQLFEKVPALHVLAPTNSEGPFKIAQLVALIVFVVLGLLATKNFRHAEVADRINLTIGAYLDITLRYHTSMADKTT